MANHSIIVNLVRLKSNKHLLLGLLFLFKEAGPRQFEFNEEIRAGLTMRTNTQE